MRPLGAFTIPAGHPSLPGHFPGRPLAPGVVLLDHAATLILATRPGRRIAGFPSVRFIRPVRPGDVVEVSAAGDRFACAVGPDAVLTGTFTLADAVLAEGR